MMMAFFKLGLLSYGCFVGFLVMTLIILHPINRETSKERKIVKCVYLFVGYTILGMFFYLLYNSDSIWKIVIVVIMVIIVSFLVDKFFHFIDGEIVEKERLQKECLETTELTECNDEESEEG